MAVQTFGANIVLGFAETITTNTTVSGCGMPPGAAEVMVNCGAAHTMQIGPRLAFFGITNDGGTTLTEYTKEVIDRDTTTVAVLDDLEVGGASGGYIYVASKHKFAGLIIDLAYANSTASSTMTGYYWNGTSWADGSITDKTASGGVTLAVDTAAANSIYWTTPTAWARTTLNGQPGLYVMRLQSDKVMDTQVEIAEISLIGDTTNHPGIYLATTTDYVMTLDTVHNGGLSFIAASASTAKVSWLYHTYPGKA